LLAVAQRFTKLYEEEFPNRHPTQIIMKLYLIYRAKQGEKENDPAKLKSIVTLEIVERESSFISSVRLQYSEVDNLTNIKNK